MSKRRLDQLLVDRGLAESREKAQALILAGAVMVEGQPAGKAGRTVAGDCRVDTGSGQIDWKLRGDPRVVLRENCNARYLKPEDIGERASLAAIDVSFISATLILPAIALLAGALVVLVKPQFEVGRGQVGKGGVVRDPELHGAACERVEAAARGLGFETSIVESPITGMEGNREFLLYCRRA